MWSGGSRFSTCDPICFEARMQGAVRRGEGRGGEGREGEGRGGRGWGGELRSSMHHQLLMLTEGRGHAHTGRTADDDVRHMSAAVGARDDREGLPRRAGGL